MDKYKKDKSTKECTYNVDGMHCASCEVLIEKKLLEQRGVEAVEASTGNNSVKIKYHDKKPEIKKLNQLFKDENYTFSSKNEATAQTKLIKYEDGKFILSSSFANTLLALGIVILVLIFFLILNKSGIKALISVNSSSALGAFFVFGLLAGTSSCAALVGGIVLSMSKQWSEAYANSDSTSQRLQPHLLFNAGRLVSFFIFGAILGSIGSIFRISISFMAVLTIGISVMMIALALQMLGIKQFQKFQFRTPKFITRYVTDEKNFNGKYMPFILGFLTFLLPCGFTITTQGLALASGSTLQGALIMFFFALGTLPMLLLIGLSTTKFTQKPHFSGTFLKIAGMLVLFFGFYNINSQLNVLGLPSLSDFHVTNLEKEVEAEDDGLPQVVDGKQILKMDATANSYVPDHLKVKVGIPVRWEITNKGVSGCSNAIIANGLFDGEVRIDEDVVYKEFTPEKTGTYKFSCWMGMISGIIEVVDSTGSSQVDENGTSQVSDSDLVPVSSGASESCGCGGSGSCDGSCGSDSCGGTR